MKKENYINKKQKREKTFPNKLNHIIKNLIAIIIWITISGKILFNLDIIFKLSDSFGNYFYLYLDTYKYLILLSIIVLSAIFFRQKGKISFIIFYSLYLVFFPAIVCYKLLFIYVPKIIEIYRNIIKEFQKIQIQFLLLCIDLLCLYLIVKLSNYITIMIAILILIILLMLHFIFLFQLITNPLMVLNNLFFYIEKLWIQLKNNIFVNQYFHKKEEAKDLKKIKKDLRQNIKSYAKAFNWLSNAIKNISSRRTVLKFFIVVFIVSIIFTVFIFSFEYYGLNKINNNNFFTMESGQYFDYFYFSLSIYSTINSDIVPLTTLSKSFIITQILLGIFLFYIFVLSFSTIALESASKDREKILSKVENILDYLNSIAKTELDLSINELLKEKLFETPLNSQNKK